MKSLKEMLNWSFTPDSRLNKSQKYFLSHEVVSCFAYSVVDGIFLSSLLILLGASDLFVALMFSTPLYCSIVQILTPVFFERYKQRKIYMLIFFGIHRILKCCIIFIPIIFPKDLWMPAIFIVYLISNIASSFNAPAFNILTMSLFTEKDKYWFMPLRQASIMVVQVLVYVVMGKILDDYNNSYTIYVAAYILSLITSVLSLVFFTKVDEPENKVTVLNKQDYMRNFMNVFRDSRYIWFMLFSLLSYFAIYLSSSFKSVYMLKYLNSSYTFVASNESLVYVIVIVFSVVLVKYAKEISWERLLKYSLLSYIVQFILLALTDNNTLFVYVLHSITLGIATASSSLSILNYRYQIMPDHSRTFYDSLFGVIFGIAALAAPISGEFIKNMVLGITGGTIQSFKLLFYLSSVLVLISYVWFAKFKKV